MLVGQMEFSALNNSCVIYGMLQASTESRDVVNIVEAFPAWELSVLKI